MLKLYCVEYRFQGPGETHTDFDHFVAASKEEADQYAEKRRKWHESDSYSVRTVGVWEISEVNGHRIIVD